MTKPITVLIVAGAALFVLAFVFGVGQGFLCMREACECLFLSGAPGDLTELARRLSTSLVCHATMAQVAVLGFLAFTIGAVAHIHRCGTRPGEGDDAVAWTSGLCWISGDARMRSWVRGCFVLGMVLFVYGFVFGIGRGFLQMSALYRAVTSGAARPAMMAGRVTLSFRAILTAVPTIVAGFLCVVVGLLAHVKHVTAAATDLKRE